MAKLVNLGSLCIDNVYRVAHLVAAGETVASSTHEIFPGGKGLNQSLAAVRAGAAVQHLGCVGDDGDMLIDVLQESGVDVAGIRVAPGAASGHAVIQVDDHGANAIVITGGANRLVSEEDIDRCFAALETGDWLLLQNEINDLEAILARAGSCPARVAFNVAPADGRELTYDLSGVDLLIVNELEAQGICGEPGANLDFVFERLCAMQPDCTIVLTLGADGLRYREPASEAGTLPAFPVAPLDETAAGDAFIGYLLAALLDDVELTQALRRASAAGALAVTRAGAASAVPKRKEVETFLKKSSDP